MPATRAPHYRVVGVLGRGATAVVELAVAPDGTRVARKRVALTGSAVDIDQARTRLRREAVVLARLRHPGIVPVLAVDDDAGDLVIVMPALVGNLADRVAAGGPLPPAEVAEGAVTLLGALATAHAAGVVHRDVKPANVLVDHRGRLALADFGLAGGPATTAGLTMAGTVLGTPAWMAPEQARGEPVGPAADVFALGATLLFAATGATPWGDGPPAAALARAASGAPCRLPATTPSSLAGLLAAMLRPDPRQRPGAAALLAAAPVAAAGGSPATAPTAPAGAPA
ncbi:MAG TPA: serine/threonine-protein kinase, partial [Acidimicrobiales bacterium]|nr:serine/threonine-protein kinase [Acidimicrobiales bacterium]